MSQYTAAFYQFDILGASQGELVIKCTIVNINTKKKKNNW